MEPTKMTVESLAQAEPGAVSGLVELDGWLVFKSSLDRGWMAPSYENVEPIVFFAESVELYELLKKKVFMLGGSEFSYVNQAKVLGTLTHQDNEYVLTDITALEVWDNDELKSLSPSNSADGTTT